MTTNAVYAAASALLLASFTGCTNERSAASTRRDWVDVTPELIAAEPSDSRVRVSRLGAGDELAGVVRVSYLAHLMRENDVESAQLATVPDAISHE